MNENNVPAGFVLVPREPTPEMNVAGAFATPCRTSEAVWRAMIAAAPVAQPPATSEAVAVVGEAK